MESNPDIKKINIDTNTLVVLYSHYKEFFLPVGFILVSILLFIFFIIPGVQNYFNTQEQAKSETQKLVTLKNNLNTLSSMDDNQLNQNLTVLSAALPSNKDFAGVINAINSDAALTGVSVGDFEFNVGDLSQTSNQGSGQYPTLQLNVNLNGNTNAILQYLQLLSKTVPLSEVSSIKIGSNFATLTILFYFKPFLASNISDESPVSPLSAKDQALISQISKWNNSSPLNSLPTLLGSPSAQTPSGFNSYPF